MNRKCLIVINPGEVGDENYCQGVFKDAENYRAFLVSPLGGLWGESEIKVLTRPEAYSLTYELTLCRTADYLLFIFCGHGYYSTEERATMLVLKKGSEVGEHSVRNICGRQTNIFDCCREKHSRAPILETFSAKAAAFPPELNPQDCRKYYDKRLADCPRETITMYACEVGQRAGDDSSRGGTYSVALLESAKHWHTKSQVDTSRNLEILSVVKTHELAEPLVVRERGDRQKPTIVKPRSEPYFPFAIIA